MPDFGNIRQQVSNRSGLSVGYLPDPVADAVHEMVKLNPDLAKQPEALNQLATRFHTTPTNIQQNLALQTQHQMSISQTAKSLVGSVGGVIGKVFGGIAHGLTNAVGLHQDPKTGAWSHTVDQGMFHNPVTNVENFGKAAIEATPQLAKGIWSQFLDLSKMAGEFHTDPLQFLKDAGGMVSDTVFGTRSLISGTTSDIKRNGWATGLGHLFPATVAMLIAHRPLMAAIGPEATAAEARAAATVAQTARDKAFLVDTPATGGLSFEAQAELASAAARVRAADPLWGAKSELDELSQLAGTSAYRNAIPRINELNARIKAAENAAKAAEETASKRAWGRTGFSKWDKFAQKLGSAPASGFAMTVDAARAFNRLAGGTRMNLLALLQNPAIKQADPKVWEEAKQGKVVDAYGNVTTVGDEIANLMNQPDGFFHKLIADFANFDLTFVADDPLVKVLKIAQQGRSFAGYAGTLGKYFGGIGITGVGDVRRAYHQYGAVRRAIDYIANHSSSEILSTFGPTIFTGKLLRRLGETNTADEVISVLDDVVAGGELVGSTAPILGWYSTFKTALRGALGDRFGFLGRLLESDVEITPNIAKQVKEETGYDISVKNRNFQRMNAAGKSNVILRQRLRTLFVKQPEWYNEVTNKMTNRDIVPGSINAIEGIMNMLRAVHLPEETVLSMGDALIHSAGDVRAYNRAYRAAMYETVMRPLQATMSAAEYEAINRAIGDHVWEHIDKMIGADGGGVTGAYVASKDEWRNTIVGPMGDMRAGIGETHLGMLKLPNARQMKMLQRNLSNIVLEMRSNGALKVLTDTTSSLKDIKEMANFSRETVESVVANLRTVLREARAKVPELWENENLYNGFSSKAQSIVRTYSKWLSEEAFKGLERGEKVALVVKDLGDELVSISEKYNRLAMDISSRLGIVPPAFTEAADRLVDYAERTGTTPDALMRAVDQLRGEQQAVEEMLAKINATLNESFTSGVSIENIAKTIAAMTLENGEARAAFVKAFKAKWTKAAERKPRIAGKIEKLMGGSGQRDLRNNRDIVTDIIQSYLNGYFKPLTLTSPGWAMRVSMSELMLNTFRIGGMNMFASNLASSIAKHEFKLSQSALELAKLGKQEKLVIRNVVGNIMLGFEREVLDRISEGQATRLVNDAMDLMLDHDGHLPMGMSHGSGDKMTADTIDNAGLSQVWGIDSNGKLSNGYYFRGENWVTINGHDAGAGTALHENINRVFNDGILSVGAKYMHEEAQRIGTAAFAANEGMYTKRIIDEAVKRIEGGPGADAWKARNAFLDDLRSEITGMSEFKALNEAERNAVLNAISNSAKSAEDLVVDDFPKYLRQTYESANRSIVNLENAIPRIENEISKQEKLVADLEAEWLAKQDERTDRLTMGEQLDEADRELRTLGSARTLIDAEIANHPFRRYYTILERGAALDPYKPILGDLRRELYQNLSQAQEATQERISALLGGRKVVLPRGGFADMSEERLLTFRDADGNPVPNEGLYKEAFEKHPELWSDNESYARHVPFGMPGVDGADFINSVGGLDKVADVQRLMRYEQQLSTAAEFLADGNYKQAYAILSNIDPVNVSEIAPLLEAGTPTFSKAGDPFSVNGVPLDLILGHGRTKEKTLADLALHVQQERNIRPTIFSKTFHPNYSMDAEGEARFKADFERFQKMLASKTSTESQKENAAKWFTAAIGPDAESWATTANKVWKQNLDTARAMAARDADRTNYYDLLERRKEISAERSKLGVRKREILRKAGALPEVSPEETAAERTFLAESDKLDSLYANREKTDIALAKAHFKRDKLEQDVLTQDEKFRDRASKRAMTIYRKRIATGTKGMGKLMRRIESRTATINAQVERQARHIVDETISGLSSASLSGEQMQELRGHLRDVMFSHLTSMPQEELQRFARAYFPRAQYSTGDPMMDWADDIAEHLITLSTGSERGTFFPEIAEQMATGNTWGPQKMAQWLSERAKTGKDVPSNFPARQFISPFAKGSRSNLLIAASDRIHSKVLGPIVNELVREPLFVWEYHTQMEKLRPLVEAKWLTYDQAKVKASIEASINMNKYVHDPLGKQVWEHNMRTLAPYYFAKNQAIRRFVRTAGDDPAQALKYLRLNLAITDYIGQASDGSGQFSVPGGEVLGSIGAGVTSPLATLLGYKQSGMFGALNFGFDASPNSLMSVILTGTKPGAYNVFREMIAIPFGPVVTMPAKYLYQHVAFFNPTVRHVMHELLGDAATTTTFTDDLLPNPFLRNTVKMAYGMTAGQNNPSSYASTENQVLKDKAQQLYSNFFDEAAKEHPSLSSIELAQFGSKEQLWGFYAGQKFAAYMNNADNYQNFLNEANLSAAVLYSLKNIISYSSPTALSIGERFSKNKKLQAIMNERDAQGHKKFPTYILAVDEYMKRYPKQVFDLVSVTKSPGARWATTSSGLKIIDDNFSHLDKYRNALSFLVSQKDANFDSEALRVEYDLGLRQKQTPREFLKSLNVAMGWRWYDQMYKAYKANPAFLDDNGELSYPAAMQLRQQALIYGQTVNHDWIADKNSGKRNTVAYETYKEMKTMVSDKTMTKAFEGSQRGYFQELVKFREGFVEAYKTAQANGESLGRYRSQWYDACTSLSEDPAWQEYSSFITNILRNLPSPQ